MAVEQKPLESGDLFLELSERLSIGVLGQCGLKACHLGSEHLHLLLLLRQQSLEEHIFHSIGNRGGQLMAHAGTTPVASLVQ